MLDVHAPEHRVGGARDFFVHLFTITVGLLIALALENAAEALHHRHQRNEAEATIREELMANRALLQKVQVNTQREISNLQKAMVFLQDLRDGKKDDPSGIDLNFNVEPLPDAAWQTASSTGALTYMDYARAQRFAVSYQTQVLYQAAVARGFQDFEVLDTYVPKGVDPRQMNQQDIQTAIPDLRRALADLHSMLDFGRGTLETYKDALQ